MYMLQTAFQMPGANIQERVIGYSRYGSYNRTKLAEFQEKLPKRTPGDSILHLAVRNNKPFCVSKLIALGSSVIAQNDIGETPLDVAKHLKDSGEDPNMAPLFRGTAVELPTGEHIIYAEKELSFIKQSLVQGGTTDRFKVMEQWLAETEITAKNNERARENAFSKLKNVRKEKRDLIGRLVEADEMRTDMQTKRDKAEAARQLMVNEVSQVRELREKLREAEEARITIEQLLTEEAGRRQLAEKQREEALLLAQKMRKERDIALQKAIAANERLKEGVGSCLSLSMTQTSEQSRLQQAMKDLEDKVGRKEKEISNLMQTQGLTQNRSSVKSSRNVSSIAELCDQSSGDQSTLADLNSLQDAAMKHVLSLSENRNGPE